MAAAAQNKTGRARDGGSLGREFTPFPGTYFKLKLAELLSGVGAVVLGKGLGLLFSGLLMAYATPLLLIGLLAHAWGMFDKHRLETAYTGAHLWWAEVLYLICWGALLALFAYIAVSWFRE
jgi:hypothetical protein